MQENGDKKDAEGEMNGRELTLLEKVGEMGGRMGMTR